MAKNRFNQIFTQQEYVPMVQPLPYEALASFGADAEKRAEEDLLKSLQLKELYKNIKIDPLDEPFYKQFDAKWAPEFAKVNEAVIKGDRNARKMLYELQAGFTADPSIRTFNYNYEVGKKAREDYAKMESEGKTSYTGWSDGFTGSAKARTELSPFQYAGHKMWSNPYDDVSKIMGGINETTLSGLKDISDKLIVGPNGKVMISGGKEAYGITGQKLIDVAQRSLNLYATTPGGLSRRRDLLALGYTPDKISKQMLDDLVSGGYKQLGVRGGGTTLSGLGEHYNPDDFGYSVMEEGDPLTINDNTPSQESLFPRSKTISGKIEGWGLSDTNPLTVLASLFDPIFDRDTMADAYSSLDKDQKQYYDNVVTAAIPDIGKKIKMGVATEDEYKQAAKLMEKVSALTQSGTISTYFRGYTSEKERDFFTSYLFGNKAPKMKEVGSGTFNDRYVYDPSTGKTTTGTNFYNTVVMDAKKNTPEDLVLVTGENRGSNPISLLTGNNAFDLARTFTVGGKNYILSGAPNEVITVNGQKTNLTRESTMNNIYFNMQFGLPSVKGTAYKVDPTSGYTYMPEEITLEDGTDVEIGFTYYDKNAGVWLTALEYNGVQEELTSGSPEEVRANISNFLRSNTK